MNLAQSTSLAQEYAKTVRVALNGLTAEDAAQLTEGLEANLAEQLQDQFADADQVSFEQVAAHFGEPQSYAEQLAEAAGAAPALDPSTLPNPAGLTPSASPNPEASPGASPGGGPAASPSPATP